MSPYEIEKSAASGARPDQAEVVIRHPDDEFALAQIVAWLLGISF